MFSFPPCLPSLIRKWLEVSVGHLSAESAAATVSISTFFFQPHRGCQGSGLSASPGCFSLPGTFPGRWAPETLPLGKGKWNQRAKHLDTGAPSAHLAPSSPQHHPALQTVAEPLLVPGPGEAERRQQSHRDEKTVLVPKALPPDLTQMMLSLIHRAKYEENESDDFLRILSVFIAMTFKNCFSGESLLWTTSLHPNMLQVLCILSTVMYSKNMKVFKLKSE